MAQPHHTGRRLTPSWTRNLPPSHSCHASSPHPSQGSHEKAVECFRRALRLDPRCLAAWTLMGHEYMEVKNTPAAIGERGAGMSEPNAQGCKVMKFRPHHKPW